MGEIASDIKHVLLFTLCMCFLQPCYFLWIYIILH
jgi:hypothetical protein